MKHKTEAIGLGFSFVVGGIAGIGIPLVLDEWFGWSPWWVSFPVAAVTGAVASMLYVRPEEDHG